MGIRKDDCFCECVEDIRRNLREVANRTSPVGTGNLVLIFGKGGITELLGIGFIDRVEDGKVRLTLAIPPVLGLTLFTLEEHVNICAIGSFFVVPGVPTTNATTLASIVQGILRFLGILPTP